MKTGKVILMLALMAIMTNSAIAAVLTQFRWWNTADNNLLDNLNVSIPASNATIITYLSPDNIINFDPNVLLTNSYGNDFFYQALENGLVGRLTTTFMTETNSPDYRGYYAYAVVLNLNYNTFINTYGGKVSNVPSGIYYDITAIFGSLNNLAKEPTSDLPNDFNAGNLKTDTHVIPEPATIGLMAIGAVLAGLMSLKERS